MIGSSESAVVQYLQQPEPAAAPGLTEAEPDAHIAYTYFGGPLPVRPGTEPEVLPERVPVAECAQPPDDERPPLKPRDGWLALALLAGSWAVAALLSWAAWVALEAWARMVVGA